MSFFSGKKVLVTGAGGFIPSHLTEALVREGANVRALVHYNSLGRWGWLDSSDLRDSVEVIPGDLTDELSVRLAAEGVDVIFHLGALIAIPYSYQAPRSYVLTNVQGTLNVLEAARHLGTPRVVHTSTSEVYGTARYVPIDEKHPLQGQSPYSASKIGADKMAESYYLSFSTPVVTVRPFNTYGPRQSARAVIPTIITQCLTGGEVKLGNLTPTRDLNFVADTVRGFLLAGSKEGVEGKTINLGSGKEISVGELAVLIGELTGVDMKVISEANRLRPEKSEVERLLASNTLAKATLGWQPEVSLREGLTRTIEWMRGNLERYRPGVYNI